MAHGGEEEVSAMNAMAVDRSLVDMEVRVDTATDAAARAHREELSRTAPPGDALMTEHITPLTCMPMDRGMVAKPEVPEDVLSEAWEQIADHEVHVAAKAPVTAEVQRAVEQPVQVPVQSKVATEQGITLTLDEAPFISAWSSPEALAEMPALAAITRDVASITYAPTAATLVQDALADNMCVTMSTQEAFVECNRKLLPLEPLPSDVAPGEEAMISGGMNVPSTQSNSLTSPVPSIAIADGPVVLHSELPAEEVGLIAYTPTPRALVPDAPAYNRLAGMSTAETFVECNTAGMLLEPLLPDGVLGEDAKMTGVMNVHSTQEDLLASSAPVVGDTADLPAALHPELHAGTEKATPLMDAESVRFLDQEHDELYANGGLEELARTPPQAMATQGQQVTDPL